MQSSQMKEKKTDLWHMFEEYYYLSYGNIPIYISVNVYHIILNDFALFTFLYVH